MIYMVKWVDTVKVLGVHQGINLDRKEYWEQKLSKIEKVLKTWSRRNLTLFGKVYLIKCYGVGILHNFISATAVNNAVIKKCETLFYKFIWGKGPERVKRDICNRSIADGGLGMIDLKTIIHANRIKMLQKIVQESNECWKILPRMYLQTMDRPNEYAEC